MRDDRIMMSLAEAYSALAATHREAAMQCGEYTSMRQLHTIEAERAESHANAWKRLAQPVQWGRLEARHG